MGIVPSRELSDLLVQAGAVDPSMCYQCNRCSSSCPTGTAMSLSPSKMMRLAQLGMKERLIKDPSIWRCLGCDSCTKHCPYQVSTRKLVELMRQASVQDHWLAGNREIFSSDKALAKGLESLGFMSSRVKEFKNVSGEENENRLAWTTNLSKQPEGIDRKAGTKTVYFVGCVSAMFPMSYGIPQSFATVLQRSGVPFTTLGGQEWCCGFPLLMSGQLEQAKEFFNHNVTEVEKIGAKQVVMTCPSCHYMWKNMYPEHLGRELPFDVLTASEFLYGRVVSGDLAFSEPRKPGTVTFHDPCDLGRKGGHYEEPREVLKRVPGFDFVEMENNRKHALCCGGGGDLETFQPELTVEVASKRIAQAAAAGADHLVSACPQCVRTLTKAAKANKFRIRVMDIVQFVKTAV
jgi:heterodisulfide reductase subunit D